MATKTTATKKKTTTKKKAPRDFSVSLYKEKNPECHVITGKYKFFYFLLSALVVLLMGVTGWLFVFSSEILVKYQSIETCARNHTSCEVRVRNTEEE